MDSGQAARLFAARQLRLRARGARRDARETREAVARTRARLRLDSLTLRMLAVRQMARARAPDAPFWIARALTPAPTVDAPDEAAGSTGAVGPSGGGTPRA